MLEHLALSIRHIMHPSHFSDLSLLQSTFESYLQSQNLGVSRLTMLIMLPYSLLTHGRPATHYTHRCLG
jgi:hypothetical protein